jgi:hypothetical protein
MCFMPVFSLRPFADQLDDPAWQAVPYQGECWVTADDEETARETVSGRYAHARANDAPCPWLQRRLVAVELFEIASVGPSRALGDVSRGRVRQRRS